MALVARSLPSVTFSAASAPAQDALPPMDVAALVGFAASGPIDVPVAVYDPVQFEEVFGDDLLLAYTESGEPVLGHLAASVRAFFQSGGRKCYVVRVAGDDAETNGFLVPGLMAAVGEPARYFASVLWARSEGAWSDGVRVGAVLRPEPYAACRAHVEDGAFELTLWGAGTPMPRVGDLVRVDQRDPVVAGPLSRTTRLYLYATRVGEAERSAGSAFASAQARVAGSEHWFEVVAGSGAQTEPLAVEARLLPAHDGGHGETASVDIAVHAARWFLPAEAGAPHRIVVPAETVASPGALIEIVQAEGAPGDPPAQRLLAGVTQVRAPSQEELEAVRGLGGERWLTALAREVLAPIDPEKGRGRFVLAAPESLRADRLTFDLWTQDGRGRTAGLSRLGFAPLSPRYVGYLPSDRALYGNERSHAPLADGPRPGSALWQEVEHPRFPLAAQPGEREKEGLPGSADGAPPVCFLPIGMESGRRIEATAGRRDAPELTPAAARDAARRSGLSRFGAELFLDPDLAEIPAELLVDAAFHKQHVQGRLLRKLHAVLALDDVSLLAVPDAVHAPWREESPAPVRVLAAPHLDPLSVSETAVMVQWSPVDPAGGGPVHYLLEESPDPQFSAVTRRWRTGEPFASIDVGPGCPEVRYYRVRAEERGLAGPWSNTQVSRSPKRAFEECELVLPPWPVPAAPVLEAPDALPDGRFQLVWSPVAPPVEPAGGVCGEVSGPADGPPGQIEYVLMQGESPDFRDEQIVYRGSAAQAEVFVPNGSSGALYFRVRAEFGGTAGPWSNSGLLIRPGAAADRFVAEATAVEEEAERVHVAMLNACASRGDMTCVMAIPAGYEPDRAAAYAARLISAFGPGRDRALGYGALYYPWTWVAHPGRRSRLIPPDGSVTGSNARRTLERGAWIAPANMVLGDVVALEFDSDPRSLEELYGAGINVIVKEARGFTLLGADTLSRDAAQRPLSVRRLLILIRKVALREGQEMVFAPNDAALRRRIRRRFESILSQLFVRGAFAGRVPDEGFRVATDEPDGIAASADRGRVVVDLSIAPSRPLEFVKVRLIQTERGALRMVDGG